MRNDFLIEKGWFDICRMEIPIKRNGELILRADAGVQIDGKWLFIEVDRRQSKRANMEKVRKYTELGLDFIVVCYKERARHFPNVDKVFEI